MSTSQLRSSTSALIGALRIFARDIQSDDGVANACIAEAADRLEELDMATIAPRYGLQEEKWRADTGWAEAARLRAALEEIESEGTGALNNAFPEDTPDIIASMTAKARGALNGTKISPASP